MAPSALGVWFALAATAQTDTRAALADKGFTFGASAQLELVGNVTGGQKRDVYLLGIAAAFAQLDLASSLGVGPKIYAMGLATFGGDPSSAMADAQVISNIEAADGVQLFRFWVEQGFADDTLIVRAGVYDLDDVFFVIDTGLLFTQSSHGIGPEISGAGAAGASTFPTTGPTTHIMLESDLIYGGAALSAGRPSHPLSTIEVADTPKDGLLFLVELGARSVGHYKYAVGAWALSADRPDLQTGEASGGDRGIFALLEHRFHGDEDSSLTLFARLGVAREAVNPISGYAGGGLVYAGLVPGRPQDRTGLAIAAARGLNRQRISAWETDLELIHAATLIDVLEIQIFAHWVVHPGFETDARGVVALGTRLIVNL